MRHANLIGILFLSLCSTTFGQKTSSPPVYYPPERDFNTLPDPTNQTEFNITSSTRPCSHSPHQRSMSSYL